MNPMKKRLFLVGIFLMLVFAACQPMVERNGTSIVIETPVQTDAIERSSPTVPNQETVTPTAIRTVLAESTQASDSTVTVQIPTNTVLPPTPKPTAKPETLVISGWLVFDSQRVDTDGNGVIDFQDGIHIYSLNIETNKLVQLTFGNSHDLYPVWSPTSTQIVFSSNRAGNFDLYTMDSNGSNVTQLTNALDDEVIPDWSPNAEQVAYISVKTKSDGSQEKTLYLMNLSNRTETKVFDSEGNIEDLNWSPNGKYLSFTRIEKEQQENGNVRSVHRVYLLDIESMMTIPLPLPYSNEYRFDNPRWLPRQDYFLSLNRKPGQFSSQSVEVFQLIIEEGMVKLNLVFVLEGATEWYTWGSNGEWLFSVISNDKYYQQVEDDRMLYDLVVVPVDFSTQSHSLSQDEQAYNYSIKENGLFITDNTYFDSLPDWSP